MKEYTVILRVNGVEVRLPVAAKSRGEVYDKVGFIHPSVVLDRILDTDKSVEVKDEE